MRHLIIPDTQIRASDDLTFLKWIGYYILDQKPDVIVIIGDWADMESLGIYDRGKLAFEGRRYKHDIDAANLGLKYLFGPMIEWNQKRKASKHGPYRPRIVVTLGNHEDRINRAIQENAVLEGTISTDDIAFAKYGAEVYPFKQVVEIDGIAYSHYFQNTKTGKLLGGSVEYKVRNVCQSFTMGHLPGRQYAEIGTPTGKVVQGLVVGSCYESQQEYQGPQGNTYWRGVVVKNEVANGNYDPCFVSLGFLRSKYQ